MKSTQRSGLRQYRKSELPRFRWTPELHEHFVEAIKRLGGKYQATPKRILQAMGVKGLRISHIKSHLQMYRSPKCENKLDAFVDMEHLSKREAQLLSGDDIKILSICSSPSKPLRDELGGPECKRWTQCPILVNASNELQSAKADNADHTEDSCTGFGDRMSNGEDNSGELHEICELSLSLFTATSSPTRSKEDQMLLPLTENRGRQIISSSCPTNAVIHISECHFGSNDINLDLTI